MVLTFFAFNPHKNCFIHDNRERVYFSKGLPYIPLFCLMSKDN